MSRHSVAAKRLRPFQKIGQRLHNQTLVIASIVLILLAVVLVNLLVTQTFKPYFKCAFLIGSEGPLNMDQLCKGYIITISAPWKDYTFPILPALNAIDRPLEDFRQFIAWDIIIFFALASLVLAFIAGKLIGFVRILMTPEGRKIVLTNFSIWLLFFVIFCTLFYFRVVLPGVKP